MNTANVPSKETEDRKPPFTEILKCKCPRCRRGSLFVEKNPYRFGQIMKMHEECTVCGQPFELEVGFYYGSSYVSYALCIMFSVATLILFALTVGLSTTDNRFFVWLIANGVLLIALQPPLMRLARSIWLAFFVRYDPLWATRPAEKPERVNEDQKNNW